MDELFGHPVVGSSWEGFVIESLLSVAPERARASFYRTARGAEIDLLIEFGGRRGTWAIEVKRGRTAKVEKGFHIALEDLGPDKGDHLLLKAFWTKGGKARMIPVRTADKRDVLDSAHRLAGRRSQISSDRNCRRQLRVFGLWFSADYTLLVGPGCL